MSSDFICNIGVRYLAISYLNWLIWRFMEHKNGFTFIEIATILGFLGIILTIGLPLALKDFADPLDDVTTQLEGFFNQAKARALATTSASYFYPDITTTPHKIIVQRIPRCDQDSISKADSNSFPTGSLWGLDSKQRPLEIPSEITLETLNWGVCVSSRGLVTLLGGSFTGEVSFYYSEKNKRTFVEMFLGGGVRVTKQ